MSQLPEVVVGSLGPAAIYSLISLGFVLIYRSTRVFNFIHGQLVFVGALIFVSAYDHLDSSFPLAVIIAIGSCLAIGALLYFFFIRPLTGQGVFTMIMVTLVMGTAVVNGLIAMTWGTKIYPFQPVIDRAAIALPLGAYTDRISLITIVVAVIIIGGTALALRYSRFGIEMRAAAENPTLASYCGVNVVLTGAASWSFATGVAAVAAIAAASITPIDFNIINLGLYAFPAIILGGMDSVVGALVGSVLLAVIQTGTATYVPKGGLYVDVASNVFMLVVLMVRPYGIFGTKEFRRL